jgi:hypothetical protein
MSPVFRKGDILGGIAVSPEHIKPKICDGSYDKQAWLVASSDGLYKPVLLFLNGERWLVGTIKKPELQDCCSPSIACIKWHYSTGEDI